MGILWCLVAAVLSTFLAFVVSPTARATLGSIVMLAGAVALAPVLLAGCSGGMEFGMLEVGAAIGVGLGSGLPFAVLLEGATIPGRVLDTLRGSQHAEVMLPHLEARGSSLEQGLALVLLWIFFAVGGFTSLLTVVHSRFTLLCGGASEFDWMLPLSEFSTALAQALLTLAPAIVIFAVVELSAALLGRMESRGGVWSELTGIKLLLGLGLSALLMAQLDGR